jgi:hypothetical protein
LFENKDYKIIRKNVPEDELQIAEALSPFDILEIAIDGVYQVLDFFGEDEKKGLLNPLFKRFHKFEEAVIRENKVFKKCL